MPILELDLDEENPWDIRNEPGWFGAFTRQQAAGAIPNGARVVKVAEDPRGDRTPLRTAGTVLGSLARPEDGALFYFVSWDTSPRVASGCVAWKIAEPT